MAWAAALAVVLLQGCGASAVFGEPAAGPGRLVELPDGRRLNFRCSGRGEPLVLLESGFGGDSTGWARVQPLIARTTRVCAYDRAGYGSSDPGPLPRDGAAAARDLDQALDAAGLHGPYVVVGHSAGALYGRLLAARRPQEVQGFVFVDPTLEGRARPGADGLDGMRRRLQRCLAAAEATPQPPAGDALWEGCVPARGGKQAGARARRPETWRNQLSELNAIFGATSQEVARIGSLLEDVPAYVITASDTAAAAPTVGYDKPKSLWELQHLRLALSFRRGYQRTVLSSHLVQNDRPDVVADAVATMVRAARAGTPPEPLAVSETEASDEAAFTDSLR